MDYRVLLIAPLAALVLSVGATGPRMPDGWQSQRLGVTVAPQATPFGYEVGIDPASEAGGSPSLTVRSVARLNPDTPSVGAAFQTAAGYAGQRVRFRGQVRADAAGAWAGLYLGAGDFDLLTRLIHQTRPGSERLLPPGAAVAADGTWHELSVVLDVPADAPIINLGLALVGEGQVWARDLHFEVVGPDVAPTPTRIGIDLAQAQRFRAGVRAQMATLPRQPLANTALD